MKSRAKTQGNTFSTRCVSLILVSRQPWQRGGDCCCHLFFLLLLFPSFHIMSLEWDTRMLVEKCHVIHAAQWEHNTRRSCCRKDIKDSAVFSSSVSFYNCLSLAVTVHCDLSLYKIALIVWLAFLGPLCERGGCEAEPFKCSSSLIFMWEEHAKVVWCPQRAYFTITWNVTVGGSLSEVSAWHWVRKYALTPNRMRRIPIVNTLFH